MRTAICLTKPHLKGYGREATVLRAEGLRVIAALPGGILYADTCEAFSGRTGLNAAWHSAPARAPAHYHIFPQRHFTTFLSFHPFHTLHLKISTTYLSFHPTGLQQVIMTFVVVLAASKIAWCKKSGIS